MTVSYILKLQIILNISTPQVQTSRAKFRRLPNIGHQTSEQFFQAKWESSTEGDNKYWKNILSNSKKKKVQRYDKNFICLSISDNWGGTKKVVLKILLNHIVFHCVPTSHSFIWENLTILMLNEKKSCLNIWPHAHIVTNQNRLRQNANLLPCYWLGQPSMLICQFKYLN